jgi:aryl-alcohol dehydrogenase-like predicted oxidoreductase
MAAILRRSLGMGVLTGKVQPETRFPADDMRHDWDFRSGFLAKRLVQLEAVRGILTEGGRTLAQGALAYLLRRSPRAIPIPGFKNATQVEENAGVLQLGPLSIEQVERITKILAGLEKKEE